MWSVSRGNGQFPGGMVDFPGERVTFPRERLTFPEECEIYQTSEKFEKFSNLSRLLEYFEQIRFPVSRN
jgi:hypothetical protein